MKREKDAAIGHTANIFSATSSPGKLAMHTRFQTREFFQTRTHIAKGFAIFDLAAFLFLVGLLIMALPIFFQPSTATSSANYRSRAVLPLRLEIGR